MAIPDGPPAVPVWTTNSDPREPHGQGIDGQLSDNSTQTWICLTIIGSISFVVGTILIISGATTYAGAEDIVSSNGSLYWALIATGIPLMIIGASCMAAAKRMRIRTIIRQNAIARYYYQEEQRNRTYAGNFAQPPGYFGLTIQPGSPGPYYSSEVSPTFPQGFTNNLLTDSNQNNPSSNNNDRNNNPNNQGSHDAADQNATNFPMAAYSLPPMLSNAAPPPYEAVIKSSNGHSRET